MKILNTGQAVFTEHGHGIVYTFKTAGWCIDQSHEIGPNLTRCRNRSPLTGGRRSQYRLRCSIFALYLKTKVVTWKKYYRMNGYYISLVLSTPVVKTLWFIRHGKTIQTVYIFRSSMCVCECLLLYCIYIYVYMSLRKIVPLNLRTCVWFINILVIFESIYIIYSDCDDYIYSSWKRLYYCALLICHLRRIATTAVRRYLVNCNIFTNCTYFIGFHRATRWGGGMVLRPLKYIILDY